MNTTLTTEEIEAITYILWMARLPKQLGMTEEEYAEVVRQWRDTYEVAWDAICRVTPPRER